MKFAWLTVLLICWGCGRSGDRKPEVRIAINLSTFAYIPVLLAQAFGYYEQEGLHVTFAGVPGSSKGVEAVLGGSADVAASGLEHAIQLTAEGRALKGFLLAFSGVPYSLVVSPRASKRIERIEDLGGATVGVLAVGSQTQLILNYLLAERGVGQAGVTTSGIGLGGTNIAAIEHGRVDAGFTSPSNYIVMKRRHPELRTLFDSKSNEGLRGYCAYVLCATPAWLNQNPAIARKLSRAVIRAASRMKERPVEETVGWLPPEARNEDASVDVEALRSWLPQFSSDGVFPEGGVEAVRRVVAASVEKVRTAAIDPRAVYTNEFVRGAK